MRAVSHPLPLKPDVGGAWPRRFFAAWAVAWSCVGFCGLAADRLEPPEKVALPELVRTKHVVFSIPFRLPAVQAPDAAPQRVVLSVSKDLGSTWEAAGEVAPTAGSFTYRATIDGEYWFRLRAVDRKGRTRGGEGPDMRVLVDAAGPKIAARLWKGADGEIICRYAAIDDSLRLDSLVFEYRGKGDQGWKTIAAEGILSRESPAHMVGEEIWWAGEQVLSMAVRITIADSAGNKTVRQFALEPADPQIDQAALARELGAPPLPTREVAMQASDPRMDTPPALPQPSGNASDSSGLDRPESVWPAENPGIVSAIPSSGGRSVLVQKGGSGGMVGLTLQSGPQAAEKGNPFGRPGTRNAELPNELTAATQPSVAHQAAANPGQPLEYRGKPLQLVRSRRFAWDYEFETERPASEKMRVELWSTRDGGVTWQRSAVDDNTASPIDVTLPAAGLYGFRLEIVPALPDTLSGPRSGDAPDSWIGVDDEPPQVELIEAIPAKTGEPGGILIRYTSIDQLLVPHSARLSYSPNAAGPWATIAESLNTQGEHRWQPSRNVPARVFVRVEATDAAGNVGVATTAEAVIIATSRVVGKLGGLRVLPIATAPAPAGSPTLAPLQPAP